MTSVLRPLLPGAVALIVVMLALVLFAVYANRRADHSEDYHFNTTTTTTLVSTTITG